LNPASFSDIPLQLERNDVFSHLYHFWIYSLSSYANLEAFTIPPALVSSGLFLPPLRAPCFCILYTTPALPYLTSIFTSASCYEAVTAASECLFKYSDALRESDSHGRLLWFIATDFLPYGGIFTNGLSSGRIRNLFFLASKFFFLQARKYP